MRDLDAYALSEDFQVGHTVLTTVRYAPPVFASAAHYAELGVVRTWRAT
ncbi:hypothetical protein [Hyalangium sp.]|nr:hypothetical protein [Hyalangium sp.]HYH97919.1 hypothetical protein [Hyalangium sp.]